ncbi:MAG: sigma-70 family RNA polymerase sigma factor [Chloroflexi bacterium]|nr:sigma-70 family RNA polymerase sigma factor [Chloroflexota bacterium]
MPEAEFTDNAALLERLRERDADAFRQVFEHYSDRLFRVALRILEDEREAEGVVQDSFLRLIESLDRLRGDAKIGTWLYRVAHNAALDRLRRRRPTQDLADEAQDDPGDLPPPVNLVDWTDLPEDQLCSSEATDYLDQAVAGLSDSLRAVFTLREIEGLSTAETADTLGISQSAVKVRLHRARLTLRERLADYFSEQVGLGDPKQA